MLENESIKLLFNLVDWLRIRLAPESGSVPMALLYVGGVLLCIHVIFTYSKEPKPEEKP